jgi:hypothetical protein
MAIVDIQREAQNIGLAEPGTGELPVQEHSCAISR